ncbi:MAG: hypothetical protein ABIH90_02545 [Candidatus Aenigmatarchaeota archaeon]
MKGLTEMLWLVVSAIVILVVALVVLAIFTNVFGTNPISDFKNQCEIRGKASCRSTQSLSLDWDLEVNVGGTPTSCQAQLNYMTCPSEWLE